MLGLVLATTSVPQRLTRSARKQRDVVLDSLSHGSLSAVRCHKTLRFVTPRARLVPSSFHTISRRDLVIPQTWLAQPHSSCVAVTWLRCHACACCTKIGKKHGWPPQQSLRSTSHSAHHLDGRAASWHRIDHSRRMLCCSVSVWHSLRLADHGLRADLLHEISWRVSSPTDPRTEVVVFKCSKPRFLCHSALPAVSGASEARGDLCPSDPASCSQWLSPHHSVSGCA